MQARAADAQIEGDRTERGQCKRGGRRRRRWRAAGLDELSELQRAARVRRVVGGEDGQEQLLVDALRRHEARGRPAQARGIEGGGAGGGLEEARGGSGGLGVGEGRVAEEDALEGGQAVVAGRGDVELAARLRKRADDGGAQALDYPAAAACEGSV